MWHQAPEFFEIHYPLPPGCRALLPVELTKARAAGERSELNPGRSARRARRGGGRLIEQPQHLADRGDAEQGLAREGPGGGQRPDQATVHEDRRTAHPLGHPDLLKALRGGAGDDGLTVDAPARENPHDLGGELLDRVPAEDRTHGGPVPGPELLGRQGEGHRSAAGIRRQQRGGTQQSDEQARDDGNSARAPQGGALAIRCGLACLAALAEAVPGVAVRLRWPNDIVVAGRKLGGVLGEARWSGSSDHLPLLNKMLIRAGLADDAINDLLLDGTSLYIASGAPISVDWRGGISIYNLGKGAAVPNISPLPAANIGSNAAYRLFKDGNTKLWSTYVWQDNGACDSFSPYPCWIGYYSFTRCSTSGSISKWAPRTKSSPSGPV